MNVVNVVKASGASAEPLSKDLHIWIDQEMIHIKAVDAHGDPVEITGETARKLAARLVEMADELGSRDKVGGRNEIRDATCGEPLANQGIHSTVADYDLPFHAILQRI